MGSYEGARKTSKKVINFFVVGLTYGWCRKWELEFDAVNENLPEIIERYGSDGRKIYADVYIDDKSCFPWEVKKDEKVGL